jgi:hypothetical protein
MVPLVVGVDRDETTATVRDCPVCGGYGYDDEWHLTAVVDDVSAGRGQRHRYCDGGCLAGFLRAVVWFAETAALAALAALFGCLAYRVLWGPTDNPRRH